LFVFILPSGLAHARRHGDQVVARGNSALGLSGLIDSFPHLFDDLWVQNYAAVKRNDDPQAALAVNTLAALLTQVIEVRSLL
jgi:hypothetical protein